MKPIISLTRFRLGFLTVLLALFQVIALAQESGNSGGSTTETSTSSTKSSIDVTTNSDNWYASPWVWVVGAALFILLLVALLGGNRGRATSSTTTSTTAADRGDRVTVQKTTRTDTDTDI